MNRIWLSKVGLFSLFWIVLVSSSWAGQVVTKDAKLWAKKALAEEKALPALTAPNTLAVLYFQNKTGQSGLDPLQKGLTLMLITDLSAIKGLQIVERVKLQALVEEMGLGASGLVEAGTAPRVGKLLGAQWLIGGDILQGKLEQLKIEANTLEVDTSKLLGPSLTEGKLTELFRLEKELLFEIIKLLKIEVKPEEERALKKLCTTNLRALTDLFRGVEASDRGNYEKAAEYYEKALKEDPNICVAKGALDQLKDLGLIKVPKRSREMLRSLRERTSLTDQLSPEDATKRERTLKDVPAPVNIDLLFP
ncbi:MAG: CsgG/HfaB family protein [Thermodesulfobacteriota bacterium]|nr:CsgG/HfaB family protein [Thermodesulfobacteriota bacterium]